MADWRRTASGLALALVATALTGCSGTKSYCSALEDDQAQLKKLAGQVGKPGSQGADALATTVDVLGQLQDRAPDDISDEWTTLVTSLQALVDAFKASGRPPSAFTGGTRPKGVTDGQYDAVQQAVAELQGTRVQQASKSIEQHAQDVCKVDLGSGLGGVGG